MIFDNSEMRFALLAGYQAFTLVPNSREEG